MKAQATDKLTFLISIIILLSSCSYLEHIKLSTEYKVIEKNITRPKLVDATIFLGRAPLSRAYEYGFTDFKNHSFSLIFIVHESSFSKSNLKYLNTSDLRQDASSINTEINILTTLNSNLPQLKEVSWQTINHADLEEVKEGYRLLLDFIRYKIRSS